MARTQADILQEYYYQKAFNSVKEQYCKENNHNCSYDCEGYKKGYCNKPEVIEALEDMYP